LLDQWSERERREEVEQCDDHGHAQQKQRKKQPVRRKSAGGRLGFFLPSEPAIAMIGMTLANRPVSITTPVSADRRIEGKIGGNRLTALR